MNALQARSRTWAFEDTVYHLDNGILGGTVTYTGYIDRAWASLMALLSDCGLDASGLVTYYSIEEV